MDCLDQLVVMAIVETKAKLAPMVQPDVPERWYVYVCICVCVCVSISVSTCQKLLAPTCNNLYF